MYQVCQFIGCKKENGPLCFLYILVPTKATEMKFIWKDRGYPIFRFEYEMDSELCTIVEIL